MHAEGSPNGNDVGFHQAPGALLKLMLVLGLLTAMGLGAAEKARPNILLCIADDWGWPHAGAYGDAVVKTPHFDRVAREGVLFHHAFSAAPSCTPSRGALLTGRAVHQLAEGANLWSTLPARFAVYPDLLEQAGYVVGATRKGWGPGNFKEGGRTRPPAGPPFKDFASFLATVPKGKPFCFWFGGQDPHRPYEPGSGRKAGLDPAAVRVPPMLPDTPETRNDILDYYAEVQRFDRDVGELLGLLEQRGELDNTLVVITADNGWPFPRGKANVYDAGSRQPFAARWPLGFRGGRTSDAFVNLYDLAPTFLDAAGLKPPRDMTGRSLLPLCRGERQSGRDAVFLERERHAQVRAGNGSYPVRAVRTREFLYIQNLRPDRWPAGDPELVHSVGRFGDCDGGPVKELLLGGREDASLRRCFQLAFDKRPAEELYDLRPDPHQLTNVVAQSGYARERQRLRSRLERWRRDTADPRLAKDDDWFDAVPYFGAPTRSAK
jgi:arylsulfatase A-like enzyme